MSDHDNQIDPALLEPPVEGRGTKRKARTSSTVAVDSGITRARASTRLAGKSTSSLPAGGGGVAGGVKGKDVGEPARGEEENLNKLRGGKRQRGKDTSASKSPVKRRTTLPTKKGKEKEETAGIDGLAEAASVSELHASLIILPRPPYPMGIRPFLYPCLRPGQRPPPPGDASRPFKRFDPHEFDDPKSIDDTASLSSDDEDEGDDQKQQTVTANANANANSGGYTDTFGNGSGGGEMDYDTQAYQSLAALLEASNDSDLFQTNGNGQ